MNTTEDSNTDKLPVHPCETKQSQPIKCDHSERHLHWSNTAEYQMELFSECEIIGNIFENKDLLK
jgi:hypothetical protein